MTCRGESYCAVTLGYNACTCRPHILPVPGALPVPDEPTRLDTSEAPSPAETGNPLEVPCPGRHYWLADGRPCAYCQAAL